MVAPAWFALRFDTFSRFLLGLLGSGPSRSGIAVNGSDIAIAMGRSFRGRARRSSVVSARTLSGSVVSRGVHGWRGDWLVNGAGAGLVEVRFDPPMRSHVLGVPIGVRRLRIAVDDPEGLVGLLATDADAERAEHAVA